MELAPRHPCLSAIGMYIALSRVENHHVFFVPARRGCKAQSQGKDAMGPRCIRSAIYLEREARLPQVRQVYHGRQAYIGRTIVAADDWFHEGRGRKTSLPTPLPEGGHAALLETKHPR